MKIRKRTIRKLIYTIMIFFIVFNPPVIKGVSFTVVFCLIAGVWCLLNINTVIKFIKNTYVGTFFRHYSVYILYILIFGIINCFLASTKSQQILSNVTSNIFYGICLIVISFFVAILMIKDHFNFDEVMQIYINIGLVQGVIGLLCYLSPSIKSTLNLMMASNSGSQKIAHTLQYTSLYRNYGFASTLYDIFGFTMSILAILALLAAINGRKRNYLFCSIIIFCSLINARTSVVVFTVGCVLILIANSKKMNIRYNSILTGIAVFVCIVVMMLLAGFSASENTWLESGFDSIHILLVEGEATGYFDTLFNDFLFFPENAFHLIFGSGLDAIQAISKNSDVGYIKNIWKYGIVGSFLIYYMYIKLFLNIKKCLPKRYKIIAMLFIILIAVYLIKLDCLGYSQASLVYMPITFYVVFNDYIKKNNNKGYS